MVRDDQELDDFDAAYALGQKVLEMADRLKVIEHITPGAAASYGFSIDDTRFQLTMKVKQDG